LLAQRVASFDSAFEELSVVEGKEFNDDEQVAILDIVEKYSPKDQDGKLLADYLLPLDKAYEIYKLNNEPKIIAKKTERNAVAAHLWNTFRRRTQWQFRCGLQAVGRLLERKITQIILIIYGFQYTS